MARGVQNLAVMFWNDQIKSLQFQVYGRGRQRVSHFTLLAQKTGILSGSLDCC